LFVPSLERWWGTPRFLAFALTTSVVANVFGTLAGLWLAPWPMAGLDPFLYASMVAYGLVFARQPVSFFGVLPMTGRQLMYGIIGFMLLFVVLQQQWAVGIGWAAACVTAWLFTSQEWNPHLVWLKWRHKRARSHLKVMGGGDKNQRWMN
jgi:membrane associated rhomboid family serine protease